QAEDGIRDDLVTGVQTCALPICARRTRCSWRRSRASSALPRSGSSSSIEPGAAMNPSLLVVALAAAVLYELGRRRLGGGRSRREIGRASCRERGWDSEGGAARRK